MVYTIEKVLGRYGSRLMLHKGGKEIPFRGFLQHSESKSWQNMESEYSPLGEFPRGQYVLLAPVEPQIQVGDTLAEDGKRVVVRRIQTVKVGDRAAYQWGLCVEKGGEDLWGSRS